ncbi:hypothetical protein LXL04_031793 [Taraxacum kok-saghyz]
MGDEEVMGSASPAPSDHKRKLDELDSEPFEQQPASAEANGNSQSPDGDGDGDGEGEGDGDAASNEDPDVKRPRLEDNSDGSEGTENGHQEETVEEEKEDITEHSDSMKNTELEENAEKSDEPLDPVNQESLNDEPQANSVEPQAAENPIESPKEDNQEYGADYPDPTPDAGLQEDEYDLKEQSTSSDQLTSRRMEVPSNKVGVLIGKGGDTIRTLQYSSGARIQITRDSEADPDALTRNVELIGSLENINKAERLIKDVIAEAEAGGSPSLVARGFSAHSSGGFGEQVHIQVPNEKVGVIIGKGGETIKNLQTRSGARIQLIPQHLPEGDQSRERTVRVTGDRKQIETAKDLIKEVMDQIWLSWCSNKQPVRKGTYQALTLAFEGEPEALKLTALIYLMKLWVLCVVYKAITTHINPTRSSTPSGQHNMRSRGSNNWGGSRSGGGHHSHQSGYNNNNYPPQRGRGGGGGGPYSSQNSQYSSPGYGNYPPQQPPPKNNYGWDQRPQPNIPEQTGYDYYGGGHPPPMHSHTPGPAMNPPPYNYGPPQDYSQQPPPSYPQTAPQGYGQGYGQHSYGQGTQPSAYPQNPGYGQQQDQYGKPMAYNMPPQQGPYYGPPRQQPYSGGPMQQQQQGYPQYATTAPAPAPVNDGYSHPGGGGYGQPVSGYGQQAAPGYAPPASGYGQYPSTQPGYGEQNSGGYGYQGAAGDQGYGGGPGMGYGAPPPVQPTAYSQPAPAPAPAPAPVQAGYDQSGGYAAPQAQPQPQAQAGYGQYDNSQMYR